MQHQLENEHLSVSVKEKGAELCSLRHKKNGLEYVWNASPDVWARHAPVLFPIVGKLKNDTYTFNGEKFSLPQHGFARDLNWKVLGKVDSRLSFVLHQTAETLSKYPFEFELRAVFTIEEDVLSITYQVKNNSSGQMPFSIGAHPGFICPLEEGERFEDYYLEFQKEEILERQLLTGGHRNGKTESVLKQEKELPLSYGLFAKDALVFEGVQSEWVAVKSRKGKHGLEAEIKGFPYLGIWTKGGAGSNFICIEPWFGVADKENHNGNIMEKEGIRILSPGHEFSCTYRLRVF